MIRLSAERESREAKELLAFIEHIRRGMGRGERRKIADAVRRGMGENFTRQRAGDGPAWAPLAGLTVLERRQQGYAGQRPILVRSGSYRASLIDPTNADHREEWTDEPGASRLDIYSEDYRADILEGGGTVRSGNWQASIPSRPALVLGRQQESRIGDTLDYILDQFAP